MLKEEILLGILMQKDLEEAYRIDAFIGTIVLRASQPTLR
jgi:hypothetical protein